MQPLCEQSYVIISLIWILQYFFEENINCARLNICLCPIIVLRKDMYGMYLSHDKVIQMLNNPKIIFWH